MYTLISEKICEVNRFTERLNFEKELKSTVWGREFQQLITRSLKNWHVHSYWFGACGV